MPTSEYLLEQAARCRRLAAHVLDKDLRKRLLELAEEYERKAAEPPRDDPASRLGPAGERDHSDPADLSTERLHLLAARASHVAEDLSRIAEDLENESAEP